MSSASLRENNLADMRHLTIILRLVLDRQGMVVHGELVNLEGKTQSRFVGFRGMARAVKTWLANQSQVDGT